MMKRSSKSHLVPAPWAPSVLLSAILLASSFAFTAAAQTSQPGASPSSLKPLLDQAHAQQASGHGDLAAKTWQQVLAADPNNIEALDGLAGAAKAKGNLPLASIYLDRLDHLRTVNPTVVMATPATFAPDSENTSEILKAGTLARQGRYTEAMVVYKQLFGNAPPPGDAALAYYETESTIRNSRPHAIVNLRRLAEKYPSDERYPLALSRVLAYSAGWRPEPVQPVASLAPHAVEAVRLVAPAHPQGPPVAQKGAAQIVVAVPPVRAQQSVLPVQDAASHLPVAVNPSAASASKRPLAQETVSAKAFKAKATIARESHEFGVYVPYQPPAPASAQPTTASPVLAPAKPNVIHQVPAPASPQGKISVTTPQKKNAPSAGPGSNSPNGSTNGESKPPADAYNTSDSESTN